MVDGIVSQEEKSEDQQSHRTYEEPANSHVV